MFHFSPRVSIMLTAAAVVSLAAAGQMQAQATLASTSTTPKATNSISQFPTWRDAMPEKLISAQVHDGILTIDGMVAKVQLNYEIQRTGYMYFFVPGMGTAIVSLAPMPDAEKVKNAFEGSTLRFTADGHTFELTSKDNLLTKDKSRTDVYVLLDRSALAIGRYPRMGYGNSPEAPYQWPLSGLPEKDKDAHLVAPPPLPRSVLPQTVADNSAPAGQK